MVNIITSKTRSKWRVRQGSKYHGVTQEEVVQRAREVAAMEGATKKDVHNAVRELTMHNGSTSKCWENFQAGVISGDRALEAKNQIASQVEITERVVDIPVSDSD